MSLLLAALLMPAVPAEALEAAVLAEINVVRAAPAAYAARLRTFRAAFAPDGSYRRPGDSTQYVTTEGVSAVDEAIAFLEEQAPLAPLSTGAPFAAAARDLAREQGGGDKIGHRSNNGDGPGQRVRRHGGPGYVGEVISYGEATASDVVRQLIVDDGVPSRGHRKILFDSIYTVAGAGCGPHPGFRRMCVVDFGSTASAMAR